MTSFEITAFCFLVAEASPQEITYDTAQITSDLHDRVYKSYHSDRNYLQLNLRVGSVLIASLLYIEPGMDSPP